MFPVYTLSAPSIAPLTSPSSSSPQRGQRVRGHKEIDLVGHEPRPGGLEGVLAVGHVLE